ncbi:MAG: hypothetical protein JWN98_2736 [Abditibacteriota bacterium]|nr:hypothetical protein [Abditibacteriota bacterium]
MKTKGSSPTQNSLFESTPLQKPSLPGAVFGSSGSWIGCAGWSIPTGQADAFAAAGSHLERYASRFLAVEINSSFYRPHRPQTYARWAVSVPEHFRFAVKVPRSITHENRLRDSTALLDRFLSEIAELGAKLGPLLVQLPPSLAYDAAVAPGFFALLRERFAGQVVCEPRHRSWFTIEAEEIMRQFEVARVTADPAPVPGVGTPGVSTPGGWDGLIYYRLHGSPQIYYSGYSAPFLSTIASELRDAIARAVPVWCIFDNTAVGAATQNALQLLEELAL